MHLVVDRDPLDARNRPQGIELSLVDRGDHSAEHAGDVGVVSVSNAFGCRAGEHIALLCADRLCEPAVVVGNADRRVTASQLGRFALTDSREGR